MKRIVYAVMAAATLTLGAGAQQEGGSPKAGDRPGRPGMGQDMKGKLGLSDEQAEKLKAAMQTHQEAMKPLGEKMRTDARKLADQVKGKAADGDIQASLDQLKSDRKSLEEENEKFQESLASFLTPTQRAKMLLGMLMRMRHGQGGRGGPEAMGMPGRGQEAPREGSGDGE